MRDFLQELQTMWVIKRCEDGAYVSRPGSASSYTRVLQHARTFPTREAAQGDCCGNERAVAVNEEMNQ